MERRYRLQKNKAFQYVYHRGRSAACRDLVMLVAKGRGMKVGFSVSKKVGNAVTRNKVKPPARMLPALSGGCEKRPVRRRRQTLSRCCQLFLAAEGCALPAEKARCSSNTAEKPRCAMKRALLWGIQFYRSAISPYKGGPRCRYTPTCSQYAQTAIERYGAVKGARLAAWRVLRCNPFSKGGYDPVPEDPCTTLRKE